MRRCKKITGIVMSIAMIMSMFTYAVPLYATDSAAVTLYGGWNETLYMEISGVSDGEVTAVSYNGPVSGTLQGEDFEYLVRGTDEGVRVDILGLKAGTYSVTVTTTKGTFQKEGIEVGAQDRSGYAHFNYTAGVGAYNDDGTLKADAIVLYVTDDNKDSVTVQSSDGTMVSGIGNILNSAGKEAGGGKTAKGGIANSNKDIIKKLAQDGTPLVVRIIGDVTAPAGLTAYDSIDYGGSVGDNGFMARIQSGKDITIEGVGAGAKINGWGIHFIAQSGSPAYGKSFEVRNINFYNVPEDCIGMEGVQSGTSLTTPVERCWIHNCSFNAPKIAKPAESDKDGGDGACDFKRGQYFTNSYCIYSGYHKTNLVGGSDDNLQYNMTYHHNYWKNCESRAPLARQANIHMYNNVVENQSSYVMSLRANCYIFSEYNYYTGCKNVTDEKTAGTCKSYNDTVINCTKNNNMKVVQDKSATVTNNNKYPDFDTNSSLSYIPEGDYILHTDKTTLYDVVTAMAGAMSVGATTGSTGGTGSGGSGNGSGGSGSEEPQPEIPDVNIPSADSYVHIIQEDGLVSDFYTFSSGAATSNSKGTVTLEGKNYSTSLKMQSATTVTFNAPKAGQLILGFANDSSGKSVYMDSVVYSLSSSPVLVLDIEAGAHTIKKCSGESYLYYLIYTPNQEHVHTYGGFVVDKHATYTEEGEKSRYCSGCNDRIEVTAIPVIEALASGIYGDCDRSQTVSVDDVIAMKQYIVGMRDDIDLEASDVNADQCVSIEDVVKLMKSLVGMDVVLGEQD